MASKKMAERMLNIIRVMTPPDAWNADQERQWISMLDGLTDGEVEQGLKVMRESYKERFAPGPGLFHGWARPFRPQLGVGPAHPEPNRGPLISLTTYLERRPEPKTRALRNLLVDLVWESGLERAPRRLVQWAGEIVRWEDKNGFPDRDHGLSDMPLTRREPHQAGNVRQPHAPKEH